MSLLVVTPIQEENRSLARYFQKQNLAVQPLAVGRLEGLYYAEAGLLLAVGGLGKVQFAVQTQHLLDHFPGIQGVICAGTAGALAEGLRAGDVVVATETVEHDCVYMFHRRPQPRFPGSPVMLEHLRALAQANTPFPLHFGPVASGDEDVTSRKRAAEIHSRTGALAVAWEGAGGARACRLSDIPYLEMRGVSDAANPLALVSFLLHLGEVMQRIGWLILQLCHAEI